MFATKKRPLCRPRFRTADGRKMPYPIVSGIRPTSRKLLPRRLGYSRKGTETALPNIISRYIWWTEERGSIHFDIMVTLILIFMFVSPHYIDFKDRPVETVALQSSEVLVAEAGQSDGNARFKYQIRADMSGGPQAGQSEQERREAILRVVEPISGAVTIQNDSHGKIVAYNAWVVR